MSSWAQKASCTISVASKSSFDSKRSRQAKNFVEAKKLGRSDELHANECVNAPDNAWTPRACRVSFCTLFVLHTSISHARSVHSMRHTESISAERHRVCKVRLRSLRTRVQSCGALPGQASPAAVCLAFILSGARWALFSAGELSAVLSLLLRGRHRKVPCCLCHFRLIACIMFPI